MKGCEDRKSERTDFGSFQIFSTFETQDRVFKMAAPAGLRADSVLWAPILLLTQVNNGSS